MKTPADLLRHAIHAKDNRQLLALAKAGWPSMLPGVINAAAPKGGVYYSDADIIEFHSHVRKAYPSIYE